MVQESANAIKSEEFFGLYMKKPYANGFIGICNNDGWMLSLRPVIGKNYLEVESSTNNRGFNVFQIRTICEPRYPYEPITDTVSYKIFLETAPSDMAAILPNRVTGVYVQPVDRFVKRETRTTQVAQEGFADPIISEFERFYAENPNYWAYGGNGAVVKLATLDDSVIEEERMFTKPSKERMANAQNIGDVLNLERDLKDTHLALHLFAEEHTHYVQKRDIEVRYFAFHPYNYEEGRVLDELVIVKEYALRHPFTMSGIPVIAPSPILIEVGRTSDNDEAIRIVDENIKAEEKNVGKGVTEQLESSADLREFLMIYRHLLDARYPFRREVGKRRDLPEPILTVVGRFENPHQ